MNKYYIVFDNLMSANKFIDPDHYIWSCVRLHFKSAKKQAAKFKSSLSYDNLVASLRLEDIKYTELKQLQ